MKSLWQSKTFWFGLFVAVAPFLTEISGLLAEGGAPSWVVSAIGVIVIFLRSLTSQGVKL